MKIVDFRQVPFFLFVTMSLYQSIFLSFVLFLTCEGTLFLRIKPLDELVEEQLEDGLTLFFEFFRIMYQSTLNSCFFCFELADMIFSFPTA